ncbi:hypothetical protein T484DRAFT_1876119, partial [Baffinella frigidus]
MTGHVQMGPSVAGLTRDARIKRLLLLSDHWLRVLGHLPGGRDAALQRAIRKEKKAFETCLKKGATDTIYIANLKTLITKVKGTAKRDSTNEFSSDEEALTVVDEAQDTKNKGIAARANMAKALSAREKGEKGGNGAKARTGESSPKTSDNDSKEKQNGQNGRGG